LEQDLRLVKAALLYADHVELYSLFSSLLVRAMPRLAGLSQRKQLALVRNVVPYLASEEDAEGVLSFLSWASRDIRRLRGPLRTEFQSMLTRFTQEIEAKVDEMAGKARTSEIRRAVDSGLLDLHTFRFEKGGAQLMEFMTDCIAGATDSPAVSSRKAAMSRRNDEMVREFTEGVFRTVGHSSTHPLFDRPTNELVEAAIRDGWIRPSESAVDRGRHGGLSGHLLQRLPSLDQATVDEVLDVRAELERYLTRFRSAVIQFSEEVRAASWDRDFPSDAERVFHKDVAPALLGIEDAIQSNTALLALLRTLARDPATFLSEGAIAVVLGASSSLPDNVALGLGGAAAVASLALVVYRAYDDWMAREQSIQQNQLYFYYQAGSRLEHG